MEKLKEDLEKNASIDSDEFAKVYKRSQTESISVYQAFSRYSSANEKILLDIFSKFYKIDFTLFDNAKIDSEVIKLIPRQIANKHNVIPIEKVGQHIILATSDPKNLRALDEVRLKTNANVKPILASEED